jgi:acetyltransferase
MTTQPTAEPLAAACERMIVTRSGASLSVRPANEGDELALEAFFDRVTAQDRRFRFLSAQAHVGPEMLAPLTHGDHLRSENFLAFDAPNGELVASAMLACDKPLDTGEIAISVRSDWRGKGVSWALLDLIAIEAAKRGLRRVISIEDRANHAAIELEREKGFTARAVDGDATLVMLEKVLR